MMGKEEKNSKELPMKMKIQLKDYYNSFYIFN